MGLSAGTGKHCVFGLSGLFCYLSLFHLLYIICAPVPAEAAE